MIKNIAEYYDELKQTEKSCGIVWSELEGKRLLVTGASGMIGSYIIDLLMCHNRHSNKMIEVYALSRNRKNIENRFKYAEHIESFHIVEHDIRKPLSIDDKVDYIIHASSNTHPLGHDLGHTPFGHAGEQRLHEIMSPGSEYIRNAPTHKNLWLKNGMVTKNLFGFKHNIQSVRVITSNYNII